MGILYFFFYIAPLGNIYLYSGLKANFLVPPFTTVLVEDSR